MNRYRLDDLGWFHFEKLVQSLLKADLGLAIESWGGHGDFGRDAYTYDAWNRLVKVTASNDTDVTLQTSEYDGKGRRMKKVVTKSGDLNKTVVYLYDGWKICETRNGSDVMVQQFIHGTQYIDELVMVRVKDKGDLYVHQDANWNVVALTDLGTHLMERYVYTPYGELIVEQETSFGDRDGDADVDSTDKGTPGSTCTGTVTGSCRILDLDFDGDYDSADATLFDSLPQGIARHPGRASTGVDQPFAHQGLLYDAEIAQYQNRHRQYDPAKRRFLQRDPLGSADAMFDVSSHYLDGLSLYLRAGSNPILRMDALGLCAGDEANFIGNGAEDLPLWAGTLCVPGWKTCPVGDDPMVRCLGGVPRPWFPNEELCYPAGYWDVYPDVDCSDGSLHVDAVCNCFAHHEEQHVRDYELLFPGIPCQEGKCMTIGPKLCRDLFECRGHRAQKECLNCYWQDGCCGPFMEFVMEDTDDDIEKFCHGTARN